MLFAEELFGGSLIRRYKRFLADIKLDSGEQITAHCANSGSMMGCDAPGSAVLLSKSTNLKRKLPYTWELVRVGSTWVGINTMRPNHIVEEGIRQGRVPELNSYDKVRREVRYGTNSRIDLLLSTDGAPESCYVEVKNVTLAEGDLALFPDAVTARGTKHLGELTDMVAQGHRAVMFYLVNRQDCASMALAEIIDPVYAEALSLAAANGVEVLAYRALLDESGIELDSPLPVSF